MLGRPLPAMVNLAVAKVNAAMSFDFSNIHISKETPPPVDPLEIFRSATVTDKNINDLWLAQGDALRSWSEARHLKDVAVVLNTGAGKTLVGLLIAQSLVNETSRQVVYACSSIQLVEQTKEKASGYGLPVTTYYRRDFSDDLYNRGIAPCVTTYQALFNGKTRFRSDDVVAVIFDDAHTSEQILRDQFSLTIDRDKMGDAYQNLVELFRQYHYDVGLASSYTELSEESSSHLFMVPPFEVHRNAAELRRILLGAKLNEKLEAMFSWEHIRDHEDLCCLLISESAVTLTPPTVPVSSLPYFKDDVRRVYLSATLNARDAFARAFGRVPEKFIEPSTTAGECERMILVPSSIPTADDDVALVKEIIRDKKALILVPMYARCAEWTEIASLPPRESVSQALTSFRNADDASKLILVARYDGIDLPGDTCRVVVIDDLPTGSGPLERFQWESLNMQNSFRSTLASRIVQSFGRISRGMSDHGVVLLTGKRLVEWILLPRNRSLLPKFLQWQIAIGESISKKAKDTNYLIDAASSCLSRDPGWIEFYTSTMRENVSEVDAVDLEKSCGIALAEASFGEALWSRDFQNAAGILRNILKDAHDFSQFTGAWFTLWLGFAMEMTRDQDAANELYQRLALGIRICLAQCGYGRIQLH